jgi:hypothetical protein
MDGQANHETDKATFTVKALPVEARELARRSANQAGLTMGAWLDMAIHSQARIDAGNLTIPPPSQRIALEMAPVPDMPDFQSARALAEALDMLARASGEPIGRGLAARCRRLIDMHVRRGLGMQPVKLRKTFLLEGQTGAEGDDFR